MEVNKQTLYTRCLIAKGQEQFLAQGHMTLGEGEGSFIRVLSLNTKVCIDRVQPLKEGFCVNGMVSFCVLCLLDGKPGVQALETTYGFEQTVQVAGMHPDMQPYVKALAQNTRFAVVNPKTLDVSAEICLSYVILGNKSIPVVTSVEGVTGVQGKTQTLSSLQLQPKKTVSIIIKEDTSLMGREADIERILSADGCAKIDRWEVVSDKLFIKGTLHCDIVYQPADTSQPLCTTSLSLAFEEAADMGYPLQDVNLHLMCQVCSLHVKARPDETSALRILSVEGEVKVDIYGEYSREAGTLSDVYATGEKLNTVKAKGQFSEMTQFMMTDYPFKDSLSIPETLPAALRPLCVSCTPLLTACSIGSSMLHTEGVLDCQVIYLAEDESVQCFRDMLPFVHDVPIPALPADTPHYVFLTCQRAYGTGGGKAVECRMELHFEIALFPESPCTYMADVTSDGEIHEEQNASVVLYFVDEGETLWDIAKHFAVTQAQVVALNPILKDREPQAGDRIILYKPHRSA